MTAPLGPWRLRQTRYHWWTNPSTLQQKVTLVSTSIGAAAAVAPVTSTVRSSRIANRQFLHGLRRINLSVIAGLSLFYSSVLVRTSYLASFKATGANNNWWVYQCISCKPAIFLLEPFGNVTPQWAHNITQYVWCVQQVFIFILPCKMDIDN